MNHFKELCELNADVQQRRFNAEIILKREVVNLVNFYKKWLNVPNLDPFFDSKIPSYIETGVFTNTLDFSPKQLNCIDIEDDVTLCIGVKTTIPTKYNDEMKKHEHLRAKSEPDVNAISVILKLQLMLENEKEERMAVAINDDKPILVFIHEVDDPDYQEVATKMKKHILDEIKNRYPATYKKEKFKDSSWRRLASDD